MTVNKQTLQAIAKATEATDMLYEAITEISPDILTVALETKDIPNIANIEMLVNELKNELKQIKESAEEPELD